jgi:alkanesulfonate monooxygenase SsuD/methylene tetrahydromethanopterin reductase-like flavin-dependent oxidoreductase (luciferase family)
MAATAQDVSGGRLILGLGAGWHREEFDAFGYPFDHRVTRFAEALAAIVDLLRGRSVTNESSVPPLRGASLVPPPSYDVPVVVAADGPRMLGLTARHADGWNTAWYGAPDAVLHERLAAMDQALAVVGRDRASLTRTVAIHVYDPEGGVEPDPDEAAVVGRDALVRALDEYEALGIGHVIVQPLPHVTATLDLVADAIAQRRTAGPPER